jgi:CheY-like chemotaxis protein
MAHGLAAQLGGALTIESEPGRGTLVSIWLPISDQPLDAIADESCAPPTGPRSGLVLLVDDEDCVRLSTAEMLVEMGFDVHEAASAEAALAVLESGPRPDILITDHLMTGMTGNDLAFAVLARWPDMRILIVSGYAKPEGIHPSLQRLSKPFVQSELAKAIAATRAAGSGVRQHLEPGAQA